MQINPADSALAEAMQVAPKIVPPGPRIHVLGRIAMLLADDQRGPIFNQLAVALEESKMVSARRSSLVGIVRKLVRASADLVVNDGLPDAIEIAHALQLEKIEVNDGASLVAQLAACGRTEDAQRLARAFADPFPRSEALLEVARKLNVDQRGAILDEALQAARSVKDEWFRDQLQASVAPVFAGVGRFEDALRIARGVRNNLFRTEALVGVATQFSPDQRAPTLAEAIRSAGTIRHAWLRENGMAVLVGVQAATGGAEPALQLARTLKDPFFRSKGVSQTVQYARSADRPAPLKAAVADVGSITNEWLRADAIMDVEAMLLASSQIDLALKLARGITDPAARAKTLADLLPKLTAQQRPAILDETIRDARAIDSAAARSDALVCVASLVDEPARRSLLDEAMQSVRMMLDPELRRASLTRIALNLPPAERASTFSSMVAAYREADALREAGSAFRKTARELTCASAYALAPGRVDDAAEVANSLEEGWLQADAFATLGAQLAAADRADASLRLVRALKDPFSRTKILVGVARHAAGEQLQMSLNEALQSARSVNNQWLKDDCVSGIAPRLAAVGRLEEALRLARTIKSPLFRTDALAQIARQLRPEQQRPILEEALKSARVINRERLRDAEVAAIAALLTRTDRPDRAHEVTTTIKDPAIRSRALAAVALGATIDQRVKLLDDAETTARKVKREPRLTFGLTGVARGLAACGRVDRALAIARATTDPFTKSDLLADVAQRSRMQSMPMRGTFDSTEPLR